MTSRQGSQPRGRPPPVLSVCLLNGALLLICPAGSAGMGLGGGPHLQSSWGSREQPVVNSWGASQHVDHQILPPPSQQGQPRSLGSRSAGAPRSLGLA